MSNLSIFAPERNAEHVGEQNTEGANSTRGLPDQVNGNGSIGAQAAVVVPAEPLPTNSAGTSRAEALLATRRISPFALEFVLKHCVRCESVLEAARQHLKPEHFNKAGESIYRVVWETTLNHYDKYQTLPTRDTFAALCKSSLDTTPIPGMTAMRELLEQNADDLIAFFFDDCELAPKVAQDLLREVLLDRVVGDSLRQAMLGNGPRDWTKLIEQQQQSIQAIGGSSAKRWQPLNLHERPTGEQYLVDGLFTSDQNCVIAGGMKCLKTTFSIYLGCCIGCGPGVKVFGRYDVVARKRVAIFSGETGKSRLYEHVQRALAAINRKLDECSIDIYDVTPAFDNAEDMAMLVREIKERGHQLVIVDPWSKAAGKTGAENAANSLLGVQLLGSAERAVNNVGAQLWLNDHMSIGALKARENGRKARIQLHDVNYGATMKWARQWMLIARNKEYGHDGLHDLYAEISGDAGQDVALEMSVDESGATNGIRPLRIEVRGRVSQETVNQRAAEAQCDLDQRVLNAFGRHEREGATVNKILDETSGWSESKAVRKASAYRLVESGRIQANGRKYRGGSLYSTSGWAGC